MKKKFIGPANPGPDGEDLGHDVTVRGRYIGNAKAGDVLEIPDDLCADVIDPKTKAVLDPGPTWSPELWEDVQESAPARKKGED